MVWLWCAVVRGCVLLCGFDGVVCCVCCVACTVDIVRVLFGVGLVCVCDAGDVGCWCMMDLVVVVII